MWGTYILMTCIRKHNHREATQHLYRSGPLYDTHGPSFFHRVAHDIVCHDKNDEVADRNQRYYARVLERVQPSQKTEWYDDKPGSPLPGQIMIPRKTVVA